MRPDSASEWGGLGETTRGLPIWVIDLLDGTAFGSKEPSAHALGVVAIPLGSNSGERVMVADEGEWLMW